MSESTKITAYTVDNLTVYRFLDMHCFFSGHKPRFVVVGKAKDCKIGGLLSWLSWFFCSCAIICGGALRAVLQHLTFLYQKGVIGVPLAVTKLIPAYKTFEAAAVPH